MHRFLWLAAASLISLIVMNGPLKADEPTPGGLSSGIALTAGSLAPQTEGSKGFSTDQSAGQSSKAAFTNATRAIRFAPCGVEADAGNSNLDAGLIDFNIPDPARAAGRAIDDQRDVGRNVGDYHSTVVLGVTLGYHF